MNFSLFTPDGFAGTIGGTGMVYGTAGYQWLTVDPLPGFIGFDVSFNRGWDVLRLPGAASAYTVRRSGSSALLDRGEAQVLIPIGSAGSWLEFDDGFRKLAYDELAAEAKLGEQLLGSEAVTLTAPPSLPNIAGIADPLAEARMYLEAGASISVGGHVLVVGSNAAETITYRSGNITFDASFNRGGDVLILDRPAAEYASWRSGSSLVITSEDGTITIPVGSAGMTIDFAGEEMLLRYDPAVAVIRIGDRAITATAADQAQPVSFSSVYTFGDSLVDAGNALGLAEWYDGLPLQDLPDGAPTAELGYFEGRFSDGYTYVDIITNAFVGTPSEPIFPFGYKEPFLGLKISPFASEPKGNNTNWAYGGAQIIRGGEAVPGLDGQTDAFRDAHDRNPDPRALYLITMGGNDVRDLVPHEGNVASEADAHDELDRAAERLLRELGQLYDIGARHFLITGIPDVGLIPRYDVDSDRVLDSIPNGMGELERSLIATEYSIYLDTRIREDVVPALREMGALVTYVPLADVTGPTDEIVMDGALPLVLPTLATLHGLQLTDLTDDLLAHQEVVFFDQVHPTGQVHALVGAHLLAALDGLEPVEILPLAAALADTAIAGEIATAGEVDEIVAALTGGVSYTAEILGMASLGRPGDLSDAVLRIFAPDGSELSDFAGPSGSDAGPGFDAHFTFVAPETGEYRFEVSGTGSLTGNYQFQLGDAPAASIA